MVKISNTTIIVISIFLCFLSYVFAIVDIASTMEYIKTQVYSIIFGSLCIIILILRLRKMHMTLKISSFVIMSAALFNIIHTIRGLYHF